MARFRIRPGQTQTTQFTLNSGDALIVADTGAIVRSGVAPAVRIANGADQALISNAGRIAVEGANGAAIQGALGANLDVTIRNASTGVIQGQQRGIELTSAAGGAGQVRLFNGGRIEGGTSHAVDFDALRATTIRVVNAEGATMTNDGASDVLRPGNDLATSILVDNAGAIRAADVANANENGDGVDLQGRDGGVAARIFNRATGLIEGGKHAVTGANDATIVNEQGGRLIGRNGSGVNFDTEAADGDGVVAVKNAGLISGRYDGLGDGDGDGVDVDYLVDVRNAGTIEGIGADNVDDFADGIAAGGGEIFNDATGIVFGQTNGILIDDGDRNGAFAATRVVNLGTIAADLGFAVRFIGAFDDRIVNSGLIETAVDVAIDTGAGDDVVVNTGVIVGDVLLGAGDDRYTDQLGGGDLVDGGDGADRLVGGDEADRFAGGLGRDVLAGRGGADVFVYRDVAESTREAADMIRDFEGDRIDLSAIDADAAADGDQAFRLVEGAFSGAAGELLVRSSGGRTFVLGDVDGDGAADLTIVLIGQPPTIDFAF